MNKQREIEIRRAIAEIENPYPKDDLILSYTDFLKVRNYLRHYQFNPIVFGSLLKLANDVWKTEKRINRLVLLQVIKQYYHTTHKEKAIDYYSPNRKMNVKISIDLKKQLFDLFKKLFNESKYISINQINEARRICNNVLINIAFTLEEEQWLCNNVENSGMILNRVLRYPIKSQTIYCWAKDNYTHNIIRSRRAELLSWIIDQEPNFEIDKQTLIDDFEFLNKSDSEAIKQYDDEIEANKIIARELGDFLPKKKTTFDFLTTNSAEDEGVEQSDPELILTKRFYAIPIDNSKHIHLSIPDFAKLEENFFKDIEKIRKVTMIWAIGYSRHDNTTKTQLLIKYSCKETYHSLYKVSKRTKNSELLKLLLGE